MNSVNKGTHPASIYCVLVKCAKLPGSQLLFVLVTAFITSPDTALINITHPPTLALYLEGKCKRLRSRCYCPPPTLGGSNGPDDLRCHFH